MTPHEFLAQTRFNWRCLPDGALAGCNDQERQLVRTVESQAAQVEFLALSDIIMNCHSRWQFAKTYGVLRADLQRTLAQPGNPNAPPHVNRAVKAALELVGRQKLSAIAGWFDIRFADAHDHRQVQAGRARRAIDVYTGKDGAGCAGAVLLALAAGVVALAAQLVA